MADLVACSLTVPGKDLFIDKGPWGLGDLETVGHQVRSGLGPVRQAQEPVRRDPKRTGTGPNDMRAGQARATIGERLTDGGTVRAGGAGQGALAHARGIKGLAQARAEKLGTRHFVKIFPHVMRNITNCGES